MRALEPPQQDEHDACHERRGPSVRRGQTSARSVVQSHHQREVELAIDENRYVFQPDPILEAIALQQGAMLDDVVRRTGRIGDFARAHVALGAHWLARRAWGRRVRACGHAERYRSQQWKEACAGHGEPGLHGTDQPSLAESGHLHGTDQPSASSV